MYILPQKKYLNEYWALVNDIHVEIFRGKCTGICNSVWNASKNEMNRGIDAEGMDRYVIKQENVNGKI